MKGIEREEVVKLMAVTPQRIEGLQPDAYVLERARGNNYLADLLYWIVPLTFLILVGVLV